MASTVFTQGTVIQPEWCNDVNTMTYKTSIENVLAYGADPTGVADSTAAFQAALATTHTVFVPEGVYLIKGLLVLNTGQHIYGVGRKKSLLHLAYNGDMFKAAGYCGFRHLGLIGNGATYSGRGIYFTGTTPMAIIEDCSIKDFNGYCIEFVENGTGTQTTVINCDIYQTTQTNPGIKLPNPETYGPARRFINIQCSGGILADVGASDNSMFIGCQANGIYFPSGVDNTTWAKKVILNACRFSTTGNTVTIYGEDHLISNCAFAGSVVLGAGAKNNRCTGNTLAGGYTFTDSSGVTNPANFIDNFKAITAYTPTWTGSVTNPTLGNGTLVGSYTQFGNRIQVNITLTLGSTTNVGSGQWSFSLPFASSTATTAPNVGSARIVCAGNFYTGVVLNTTGATNVSLYSNGVGVGVGSASPGVWATGNSINLQIDIPLM